MLTKQSGTIVNIFNNSVNFLIYWFFGNSQVFAPFLNIFFLKQWCISLKLILFCKKCGYIFVHYCLFWMEYRDLHSSNQRLQGAALKKNSFWRKKLKETIIVSNLLHSWNIKISQLLEKWHELGAFVTECYETGLLN